MITVGIINEQLAIEPFQDRVLVLMDGYRSGRECLKCEGKMHLGVKCEYCKGTKFHNAKEENGSCRDCEVGTSDLRRSLGFEPCDLCKGTGTSSIIIPEDSQTRPTTGKIVGIGALCGKIRIDGQWIDLPEDAKVKKGDRVIFTNFSGNEYELPDGKGNKVKFRLLKEVELMGRLHGVEKKTLENTAFAELEGVGINS